VSIRKSKWKFKTSTSNSVSIDFIGGQNSSFVLTSPDGSNVTFRYLAAGAGVSAGANIGTSSSTEDNWSVGDIFMTDGFSGRGDLEVSDIEGACQIFDAGAGVIGGISGTVMALGIPTKSIPHHLARTSLIGTAVSVVRGETDSPTDARALLIMTGVNKGLNISIGVMGSYGKVWASDVEQAQIDFSPKVSDDALKIYATSRDLIYLPGSVLFNFGDHKLKPAAFDTLMALKRQLQFMKPSRISVEGHTDVIGTAFYNRGLSYRRAWSVAQWLIMMDAMNAARIAVRGFGHTRPIARDKIGNADNPEGREKNRRVEVRLYWS
jgi:outer membrane protein OmpA-like peptidoglycan-associated protein